MTTIFKKALVLFALVAVALVGAVAVAPAEAQAATGSFTIQSKNAEFAGKTVTAYQMFTVENPVVENGKVTSATYTLNTVWEGFFQVKLSTSDTGAALSEKAYSYVKDLVDGNKGATLVTFAKEAADYAKTSSGITAAGTANASTTADNGYYKATFTGLEYGYYIFAPQGGSTSAMRGNDAMLYNVVSATSDPVELKSVYPGVTKTVENGDKNDNHSSAQVGDKVSFTLRSAVPDTSEYNTYTFVIHDTLSTGLTFNNDVKVTVGGKDYTIFVKKYDEATRSLSLDFSNDIKNLTADDAIVVTYSATLNENAVVGKDNLNTAHVEYSNNPGGTGTGTSEPSKTHTYDFGFDLKKIGDNDAVLSGAEFQLLGTDGTAITLISDGNDGYRPIKTGETGGNTNVTTPENGIIKFTGLKEGVYKLSEVKAPSGYNKLAAPVKVTIAATYNADGTLINHTVTADGATGTTVTVKNNKGTLLPSTGGMGTVIFTVAGAAIVIAGVAWTIARRRAQN